MNFVVEFSGMYASVASTKQTSTLTTRSKIGESTGEQSSSTGTSISSTFDSTTSEKHSNSNSWNLNNEDTLLLLISIIIVSCVLLICACFCIGAQRMHYRKQLASVNAVSNTIVNNTKTKVNSDATDINTNLNGDHDTLNDTHKSKNKEKFDFGGKVLKTNSGPITVSSSTPITNNTKGAAEKTSNVTGGQDINGLILVRGRNDVDDVNDEEHDSDDHVEELYNNVKNDRDGKKTHETYDGEREMNANSNANGQSATLSSENGELGGGGNDTTGNTRDGDNDLTNTADSNSHESLYQQEKDNDDVNGGVLDTSSGRQTNEV